MDLYKGLFEFLKLNSDVDVPFIEDFIRIQKEDTTHDPFKIDLETMAKWLKARKGHLKETLVYTYTENIDYMVIPDVRNQGKLGHNKEIVLLTEDCFKMMCLASNAKDAFKIRYYYVTLEKLLLVYMNNTIESQQKKIESLTNNLLKRKYPVKGAIYVMSIPDTEGYKLGKTENLNSRYETYKNAHKDNPKYAYVFYTDDINRVESCVKSVLMYEQYRDRKEFYILELADIVTAIKNCDNQMINFRCNSCKKTKTTAQDFKKHIEKKHNKKEIVAFHSISKNNKIKQ